MAVKPRGQGWNTMPESVSDRTIQRLAALERRVAMLAKPEVGGWRFIAGAVLAAPAASVIFAAIPGHYQTLILHLLLRSTRAAPNEVDDVRLQFNADVGNRYHWGYMQRFAAAFGSGELLNQASLSPGIAEAGGSTAGFFCPTIVEVVGYNRVATSHYALSRSTNIGNASAVADFTLTDRGGAWVPLAATAITSVTVFCGNGNIDTGSVLTLSGML